VELVIPKSSPKQRRTENTIISSVGPFLKEVTKEALFACLEELQNKLKHFPRPKKLQFVDVDQVLSLPFGSESPFIVKSLWSMLNHLVKVEHHGWIQLQHARIGIMLLNHHSWDWLCKVSSFVCQKTLGIGDCDEDISLPDWMLALSEDLKSLLIDQRCEDIDLNAARYHQNLGNKVYTRKRKAIYLNSDDECLSVLTKEFSNILASWLGYPNWHPAFGQYKFVSCILDNWGKGGLLLSKVWDAYNHVYGLVFTKTRNEQKVLQEVEELYRVMQRHLTEEMKALVDDIQSVFAGYLDKNNLGSWISLETKQGTQSKSSKKPYKRVQQPPQYNAKYMVKFLRKLLPIVDKEGPAYAHDQKFFDYILEDEDGRLPFRTKARGWKKMANSDAGPLSPDHLRTTQGLFSLMVWRGITFRTKLSEDHEMLFTDIGDFLQEIQGLPVEDVCNIAAYGTPNPSRHPSNAEMYWAKANDKKWNEWLIGSHHLSFKDLVSRFKELKSFGNLVAYLATADYADAGAVPIPTAAEVGSMIDLGAAKGLKLLGYAEDKFEECYKRFKRVLLLLSKQRCSSIH
jgi:hypothetical protein